MKISYSLALVVFAGTFALKAQNVVNADCINAIPLCTTPNFTFYQGSGFGNVSDLQSPSNISNPTTNPASSNSGCLLSGELNPQWLLLTVGNAGSLEFVFGAANSANPQVGLYDWAMWPYSPTACASIQNNTLPPIRCNWNGSGTGGTGIAAPANIPQGGSQSNFEPPIQVNACQQFIICISNYSGVNTLVSFQSIGTASLSCNPNCNPNYSVCAGGSATIVPVNFAALTNPSFSMNPGGITSTTGSFVVTPGATSNYTTYITGTNAVNAIQTLTSVSTVSVFAQPSAIPSVTNSTCTDSITKVNLGLTFVPAAPVPNYTVSWLPIPNGVSSPTQTSFSAYVPGGIYNAVVTTANGCSVSALFTVKALPEPASITFVPLGPNYTVTCFQPTLVIEATDPANSYTWTNINTPPVNGPAAPMTFSNAGTWTVNAVHQVSGCTAQKVLSVFQNTTAPTSAITPTLQNITCNLSSITTVTASANPTVNVSHHIYAPQGGTFSATSHTMIYTPGGIGEFTHCAVNDVNGCSTCQTFTVTSNQGFPTFSVGSTPGGFTLGCNSKSVTTLNIIGAASSTMTPGAPVSYTVIGPPTTTATQTGSLSGQPNYSVNVPGTWTLITRDNNSQCETRVPVSVISNTFGPDIITTIPRQVLTCDFPSTVMKAQSSNSNVDYLWSFPGTPGSKPGDTIYVAANFNARTNSVVANYTLSLTDKNNTCVSTTVIPVRQNIYLPNAAISGMIPITCKTTTVMLTNQSTTGIPPATGYPRNLPSIGYLWEGPPPQENQQLTTSYVGGTPGTYTLTTKDMNNGCLSKATATVPDQRIFPVVNNPTAPPTATVDCGASDAKVRVNITSDNANLAYDWMPPASMTPTMSGANTATLSTNLPGIYRVVVTNTMNGCATSVTTQVVSGSLFGDVLVNETTGFAPFTVTFTNASQSSLGTSSITSFWSFGNGTQSVTPSATVSPVATYSLPGTYTVTTFVSKGSCLDTVVKTIHVETPSELVIPNVFTPNGDNSNDIFLVKSTNLTNISIVIVDRWGEKVYELNTEKGNVAWDGKNQFGKEVSEGTYFYTLKATGKDGTSYDRNGNISLYR